MALGMRAFWVAALMAIVAISAHRGNTDHIILGAGPAVPGAVATAL